MPTIYNKVEVNGNTLIDLSTDTVTSAEHIVAGYVGHLANGTVVTGTGQGASTPNLQSKTATPTESIQTITADSTYDGLSSVEVGAIDSKYIGSEVTQISSNSGITINGATVTVAGQAYWIGNVSKTIPLQSKTATPTESTQTITADSNYSGLSSVEIGAISSTYVGSNISRFTLRNDWIVNPSETQQEIMMNGEYLEGGNIYVGAISSTYVGSGIARKTFTQTDALAGLDDEGGYIFVDAGYYANDAVIEVGTANSNNKPTISIDSATGLITSSIDIGSGWVTANNAGTRTTTQQLTTQSAKTVTPTESSQTAVAAGVYTTGAVTVGAISSTYVGSGITQRDDDDLTVSGATVTVPAGYYAESASKSISSGSATTPATTITANPSISVSSSGLITATASASQSITPTVSAGYVSSGTAGTVAVSGSNTSQLTTKAAGTYYPSTTDQTISASQYLTGTQTIKAVTVSGLTAANIANGVTVNIGDSADADRIMSVTGTLAFQTIYTGTSTPSSSTGSNGDIYIKTS